MIDREKLVELINEGVEIYTDGWQKQFGAAEAVADHLIENGVAVQPVTEKRTGLYGKYSIFRADGNSVC